MSTILAWLIVLSFLLIMAMCALAGLLKEENERINLDALKSSNIPGDSNRSSESDRRVSDQPGRNLKGK